MYMIWGWGHEVETLGLHLVDDQGDIGQDVVEGRGALVDDPKLNLALEEQGRYCGSWQDLDQEPAQTYLAGARLYRHGHACYMPWGLP